GPLLGQAGLDVAGLVVVEERGGAGEGHQVRLPRGLALSDVALDEDVEVPVVVEVAVQRRERARLVELQPLHLGEADDVRDGAGLQGGGELLVEVLVAAHRFGDRDDLVLGLVELGEQGREHLVVLAGEGGPEQDRGAALVLGGHGGIGLGEARGDGGLGGAAPPGRAGGGEAGRGGAGSQGGGQAATGGGERTAGHVGGS